MEYSGEPDVGTPDVVVIGAGSTGAVIAARLAEDPDCSVLLVEAGGAERPRDPRLGSLASAFDPRTSIGWAADLGNATPSAIRAGRTLGGSSSINGGYFIRPTATDLDRWALAAGHDWSADAMTLAFKRLENDLDYGGRDGHGSSGPMTVERDLLPLHPVSEAFIESALSTGAPFEEDKNSASLPGVGPVPFNVRDGLRLSTAEAYLASYLSGEGRRDNLTVISGSTVTKVLVDGSRVTGVAVDRAGEILEIRCTDVIVSAGALGSPTLLWNSGIGSPDDLKNAGIPVVAPLRGVGANLRNHPCIDLFYQPVAHLTPSKGTSRDERGESFMQTALHASRDEPFGRVDFEVMATRRPYGQVTGLDPTDESLSLRLTLTSLESVGSIHWRGGSYNNPQIRFGYLDRESDLARLRCLVRSGAELMDSPLFGAVVDTPSGPDQATLDSDHALDEWVRSNIGTTFHLTGSCSMGDTSDPLAVVDSECRVIGLEGLRVADASVVPSELSRGPAALAVAIGERLVDMI